MLCGLLLAVLAWPAFALGLGQIEVKSQAGQPLLAEIPIISSDPSELENLQARLASPETFARIGLQPPTGLVSDLRFTVALDARGRPVIRITSDAPVQQPMLTFLVEVDWGQGRLVREYSALVDTPQTVAAPAQPPIQAPVAAPSNTIVRPPETATPETAPADEALASDDAPAAEAEAAQAVAETPPPAPAPPTPAPTPAPAAPAAAAPGEYGPVQRGQTLGEIASSLSVGSGHSLNQVMLALLRANPEAFIGGNLNLIRQGAVLRVPVQGEWSEASVAEANAVVREHVGRWREMRRPVPQPDAVAEAGASTATASATPAATAQGPARVAGARLEIVPPSSGGGQDAGTRTGTAAGGEGDMLQQQELVQTRETLAARDAEVQELKTRLAELEQLQQQQQQLIQMKDSELAAAQQRLAESNNRPAPTLAQADAAQPAPAPESGANLPWLWIGLGLLAAALLAWWLASRRKEAPRDRKPGYGFASSGSAPPASSKVAADAAVGATPEPEASEAVAEPAAVASSWQAAPAAATGASPTWHAGGDGAAQAASVAPLNPAPAGQERIELARAYLDLGDTDTARTLLQEVADFGDAGARGEAQRLLRELV
ncbi:ferrous iron transporter B [Luteimonas marina]|uniref:Ferrous iron transporter B n=2 Tax=Luteimonas marina TaxID=488485 RepID=A0A5C5UD50_9GAMM|nr:ferrous iron transporter B [Luteimonas marina]